jgi:Cof subfamily protein (haloacid dehalogenase superfamily)
MRYKLMLIDCDRTLLNDDGCVTERTRRAIKDSIARGVKVVFASGRAPGGVENVIKAIGAESIFDYYVCYNGGIILRSRDKYIINENYLTVDDVIRITENVYCEPRTCYVLTQDRIICNDTNIHATIEADKNSIEVIKGDVRLLGDKEKIFKVVFADEKERLDETELRIPETLRKQYNVTRSEPNNLEFVSRYASKGRALIKLAEVLNIRIEDTICFGDSGNDSSMIELAGTGVAMGNANEELKGIADIITDNNNNDGLAKAIEKYVLTDTSL